MRPYFTPWLTRERAARVVVEYATRQVIHAFRDLQTDRHLAAGLTLDIERAWLRCPWYSLGRWFITASSLYRRVRGAGKAVNFTRLYGSNHVQGDISRCSRWATMPGMIGRREQLRLGITSTTTYMTHLMARIRRDPHRFDHLPAPEATLP
jgi:hypothetical protein